MSSYFSFASTRFNQIKEKKNVNPPFDTFLSPYETKPWLTFISIEKNKSMVDEFFSLSILEKTHPEKERRSTFAKKSTPMVLEEHFFQPTRKDRENAVKCINFRDSWEKRIQAILWNKKLFQKVISFFLNQNLF